MFDISIKIFWQILYSEYQQCEKDQRSLSSVFLSHNSLKFKNSKKQVLCAKQ